MAEERLIDEDKDKKYRFRLNADGEEELVLGDEEAQPEEDGQTAGGELTFEHEDDEQSEYASDTPEYTAFDESEQVANLLSKAEQDIAAERYSTALEYIAEAKEIDPSNGDIAALELKIYTKNMTDFSDVNLNEAAAAAENVAQYCSSEAKQQLAAAGADKLRCMIEKLSPEVEKLRAENEQGKQDRAVRFEADNKKSVVRLLAFVLPFVVSMALSIYFSTVMFADTSGVNIVLTIVFSAVSVVLFIACLFALRALSVTARRVRMNRDNMRTQVGRDYERAHSRLEALRKIYDCVTE